MKIMIIILLQFKFAHRTFCVLIYVLSASLIIAYGLKLGRMKSLHWLMTILITIIQSAFLAEPLQIIISSCILFKLNKVT